MTAVTTTPTCRPVSALLASSRLGSVLLLLSGISAGCTRPDPTDTDTGELPDTDTDEDSDSEGDTDTGGDTDTDTDTESPFILVERLGLNMEAAYGPSRDVLGSYQYGGPVPASLRVNFWGANEQGCVYYFERPLDRPIPFSDVETRTFQGDVWVDLNDNGAEDEGERSIWETEMWVLTLDEDWVLVDSRCEGVLDPEVWGDDPVQTLRDRNVGVGFGGALGSSVVRMLEDRGSDPTRLRNSCIQLDVWEPRCRGPVHTHMWQLDASMNVIVDEWDGMPVKALGDDLWDGARDRPERGVIRASAGQPLEPWSLEPSTGP